LGHGISFTPNERPQPKQTWNIGILQYTTNQQSVFLKGRICKKQRCLKTDTQKVSIINYFKYPVM